MSNSHPEKFPTSNSVSDLMVNAEQEPIVAKWFITVCVIWSLFQLWTAADFPFYLSQVTGLKLVFNSQEVRQIHLAFGIGLALAAYQPKIKINALSDRFITIILVGFGIISCIYLYIFKLDLVTF